MRYTLVSCVLKDSASLWGISKLLLLECTTYQLSCHCFRMCCVCLRNRSERFSMWQLFSKVTDAIGRNGKASNRVYFTLIINPILCLWRYLFGCQYISSPTGSSLVRYFHIYRCVRSFRKYIGANGTVKIGIVIFTKKNFSMYCILLWAERVKLPYYFTYFMTCS